MSALRGRGVCPVLTCCGQGEGEVLQMRTSALFDAMNLGYFEIYGVSSRTRGRGFCQCGQGGRGKFFAILCGRPLWTASNLKYAIKH